MIFFHKPCYSFCSYACLIFGLFIYLYGFFPFNTPTKHIQQDSKINAKQTLLKRHVDKLVFIVIDSLRNDFVIHNTENVFMPFTALSILNNESCHIVARADSPTVTMPRIKALTSGMSSTYADVLLNFMSSDFVEDNFVSKASLHGLKIIFYGDDTWLKLFPKAFLRSEGTNSFFALDFTEVDNNVTRHIANEMEKPDWDIMILHYLGLDHIGHLEGPKSIHTKPKLKEMDNIVQAISSHLKLLENRDGLKTMVIVTGDHGMKDSGGHGGVTYAEIMVPIISIGKPCKKLVGWEENNEILQVDIAPTISALLGFPPPANNLGKIIPNLLYGMETDEIIQYLEINSLQLLKIYSTLKTDSESKSLATNITEFLTHNMKCDESEKCLIVTKYFQYLHHISQHMNKTHSNYKFKYILIGLALLWMSLCFSCNHLVVLLQNPIKSSQRFLLLGVLLHALSFASSSFIEEEHQTWYFLWITLSLLVVIEAVTSEAEPLWNKIKIVLPWILICFTHRVLRRLNQTGDKWASIPDIKTFLYATDNQTCLNLQFFSGILMNFYLALKEECSRAQLIFYSLTLFSIICFRASTGNIKVQQMNFYPNSRGTTEITIFWISFTLFLGQSLYSRIPSYLNWLALGSLLLRPHNVILLPIQVLISRQINKLFKKKDIAWSTVVHVWMGNVFYFYQGNGNSLANVDVAPGFIGLIAYNQIYAGIMITAHLFNSQILTFLMAPELSMLHAALKMIPLVFYCTTLIFQLSHLFIWSVFSPKLLYEAVSTLLILAMIFTRNVINEILKIKIADRRLNYIKNFLN